MENKAVYPSEKVQEIIDMIKYGNALLENPSKTDSEVIKLLEVARYLLGVEEN